MTYISTMQITLTPGLRDAAIKAFQQRRVFEECADVIPGFLWARLIEDAEDPDKIAVLSEWSDASAYDAWAAHPVRDSQYHDLAQFIAAPPDTTLHATRHDFVRGTSAS